MKNIPTKKEDLFPQVLILRPNPLISHPTFTRYNSNMGRVYRKFGTLEFYTSVTNFLSQTSDQTWLQEWVEKVGEEEADRQSKIAIDRGNEMHMALQKFVTNRPFKIFSPDVRLAFNSLKNKISENLEEVYFTEKQLYFRGDEYPNLLPLVGTCDCFGQWKGGNAIIDWKGSNRDKENIDEYALQTWIYALMVMDIYQVPIDRLVIPVFSYVGQSKIFEIDVGDPNVQDKLQFELLKRLAILKEEIKNEDIIISGPEGS